MHALTYVNTYVLNHHSQRMYVLTYVYTVYIMMCANHISFEIK